MKQYNYFFEIRSIIKQFEKAFDNIIIKRYDKNNIAKDQISVRYIYAPKQRALYSITDLQKNYQVPAIAINISQISRDLNRNQNIILPNSYINNSTKIYGEYLTPLPINIDIQMSIISRNEDDIWQIISNFAPYSNPYIILSFPVPPEFNLPNIQEIRTPVDWNGSINLDFPVNNVDPKTDMFYTADTSFTVKGWLFKPAKPLGGIIYNINTNFYSEMKERDYNNTTLSSIQSTDGYDATVINTLSSIYKIN